MLKNRRTIIILGFLALVLCSGSLYFSTAAVREYLGTDHSLQIDQNYIITPPPGDIPYPPASLELEDVKNWNDRSGNGDYVSLNGKQLSKQIIRLKWGDQVTLISLEGRYALVQVNDDFRWVETEYLK